jgi:glycosyltransferase involved in cell wall biosynthesis
MKIFQILPELNSGGVELCVMELSKYLASQGHEAVIISNGGRMVESLAAMNVRHIAMPVHRKSFASLLQVRRMRKLLEQEKPDIVHIHSRVPGWITYLAWRNMDPQTRPRLVSTVHGFYSVSPYSAVMTKGERVVAVSEGISDYIFKNYPKADPAKTQVIYGGIDPAEYSLNFSPASEWLNQWHEDQKQLSGKIVLLLPGRITRWKGQEDFIQLIAHLRNNGMNVHGLMAGETHVKKANFEAELSELAERLGVSADVTFLGNRRDLKEVMAVSDLVLSLSHDPEAFGRVSLEAMALGKPVVAYDHGGVSEQLKGIFPQGLVEPNNQAAVLAKTMEMLNSREQPNLDGKFTLLHMLESNLAIYQELTSTLSSQCVSLHK